MVQRTKLAMCWMQASQQNALCVSGHITHHSPWNPHTSFATLLINANSEVRNESIGLKRALQWNPAQMPGHMNQETLFDASESSNWDRVKLAREDPFMCTFKHCRWNQVSWYPCHRQKLSWWSCHKHSRMLWGWKVGGSTTSDPKLNDDFCCLTHITHTHTQLTHTANSAVSQPRQASQLT